MDERRAHPRFDIGFGAEVHTDDGIVAAATRDVSLGGCRLAAELPLPEGGNFVIDLKLTFDGIQEENFPPLRVRGQVRWTAEGEDEGESVFMSGLQFEKLSAEQEKWLEQVITAYQPTK